MAQLTGRPVRIASTCPACGGPIRITLDPHALVRVSPPGARVWLGARGRAGPLARHL